MTLPPIPPVPHLHLPHQVVIPVEALASFWAMANIAMGFIYLLYGLKVFRVMTTITAVIWGAALGMIYGYLIDSVPVAMIFCGTGLGMATWFYTRWMIAVPFGLGAAALGWMTAQLNDAGPLAAFFIALGSAVAVGGPVIIFYRMFVMGITCIQGAVLVVFGTATGILVLRRKPLASIQDHVNNGGHLLLAAVCILLLAIPAFYFQRLRYGKTGGDGDDYSESDSAKESAPRRKAA